MTLRKELNFKARVRCFNWFRSHVAVETLVYGVALHRGLGLGLVPLFGASGNLPDPDGSVVDAGTDAEYGGPVAARSDADRDAKDLATVVSDVAQY